MRTIPVMKSPLKHSGGTHWQVHLLAVLSFLLSFTIISRNGHRPEPSGLREHEERTGALQALDFWTRARAYPGSDIPPGKYWHAFQQMKTRLKEYSRTVQSTSSWKAIGPLNLSGRAISVAVNPLNSNTVYVGSASGGLWRSRTAGLGGDWERIRTGFPVLGVGAIAISPVDSNLIYIGTGEVYNYLASTGGLVIRTTRGSYGIGILKTTDGGTSWVKSLDWAEYYQSGIQCIRFNPLNPRTILAATSEGIYKSTDAGESWYLTNGYKMAEDILINPVDTTLVLASVGNFSSVGAGLYYSNTGGETWSPAGDFPAYSGKTLLDMYQAHPNVVYASVAESTTSVGSLWRSTDFGLSWTELSSQDVAGVQGWYSHFVAVHPNDSSQVIRGGVSIYKSTDGGRTFFGAAGSYADHHAFARDPVNPGIIYNVNDDGLYRSTDFGNSYTNAGSGMQTGQFYNGFSSSGQDSLYAVGQTQDHIAAWVYQGSPYWGRIPGDEVGWTAMDPNNDQVLYEVDRNGGNVLRLGVGYVFSDGNFGAWNTPIIISASNPAVLYFPKNLVYRTLNTGTSWSATSAGAINDGNVAISAAMSFTDSATVYIGKAPYAAAMSIFRTTNAGSAWTNISSGLPNRYPLDIAVDPNNSRVVYIGLGGYGLEHIFKSTNGGTSWSDISGNLPDIPVTAVIVDPQNSNYVYIGTDIGVNVSSDGGASWSNFSEGLPDAILVSDLSISPSNRTLRAVTHGSGVFERKLPDILPYLTSLQPNGGEQWVYSTSHQITWDEGAVAYVRIDLSTDNGLTWSTISDSVPGGLRSYSWTIPYVQTQQAKIRITSLGNPALVQTSQNPFTLYFRGGIMHLTPGWNMVSLPSRPYVNLVGGIFTAPHAAVCDVYSYNPPGYSILTCGDSMTAGSGYWIRYPRPDTILFAGDSLQTVQIPLEKGWNLIGSITEPVPVSSLSADSGTGIGPDSRVFTYQNGYRVSDTLLPGIGYWIKSDTSGILTLSSSSAVIPKQVADAGDDRTVLHTLKFRDAVGGSEELQYGTGTNRDQDRSYGLPPLPPEGSFDVRFSSQSSAAYCAGNTMAEEFVILLQGIAYPLRLSASGSRDGNWAVVVDGVVTPLMAGHDIVIDKPVRQILLRFTNSGSPARPEKYALFQNYPNPFNPSTAITYDVPEPSHISVKIYTMLGQEIAALVDREMAAGHHSAIWNASGMPSGLYILQMKSGGFVSTRKMLLLR